MGILQKQLAVIAEFEGLADWEARYGLIIARGRALPELPTADKTDAAKVRGCSSSVWLHARFEDGLVHYRADSDAILVRGLVALLLEVYSGETPAEILAQEPHFIAELGLHQHLTTNRANGLGAMMKQIKTFALAYQQAPSSPPPR